MAEREWDGKGTMPSLQQLARTSVPGGESSLRYLQLIVVALLAGVILAALIQSSGAGDWLLSVAAGAVGALAVAGVVWTRGGYGMTTAMRHAEVGWSALHSELARSRRHDRSFVLIAIPEEVWSTPEADHSERAVHGLSAAVSLHALLRTPDRAWTDGALFHVLLTECDREQADSFLSRARDQLPHLFPADKVRLAVFPKDGITVGALLAELRQGHGDRAGEDVTQ